MTAQPHFSSLTSGIVNCHGARSLMEAFVDGELSPEQTLEMEDHLDGCHRCQANADFLRVISATVRHTVHPEATPLWDGNTPHARPLTSGRPSSTAQLVEVTPFMARLERAIEAEIDREASGTELSHRGTWIAKVTVFAAAASASLWFGVRTFGGEWPSLAGAMKSPLPDTRDALNAAGAAEDEVLTFEGALDRLIDYHSSPPQPQVTSVDLLPKLEPDVGVRMQLPKLDAYGARWEGASLVPVRNQRAASFRYQLPKNRVTLYVFNASRLRVHDSAIMIRETPQPVYFGQWRGYNVAAKENRGVGYALATDMDGPAVAKMIQDIH